MQQSIFSQIWDLSDPEGKGHLDRKGLFVACKLVALAQDRQDIMVCNLLNECPAPNFGDATAPGAPVAKAPEKAGPNVNFLVKPEEKRKYDALFAQLQPTDDKLPGDKVGLRPPSKILTGAELGYLARFLQVRQVMMGSKLAMPVLGKIWDLSDVDRDGMLDQYEFTVAMHLVYRRVECLCECHLQCLNV